MPIETPAGSSPDEQEVIPLDTGAEHDAPLAAQETISAEKEFFENSRHLGIAYYALVRGLAGGHREDSGASTNMENLDEAGIEKFTEIKLSATLQYTPAA